MHSSLGHTPGVQEGLGRSWVGWEGFQTGWELSSSSCSSVSYLDGLGPLSMWWCLSLFMSKWGEIPLSSRDAGRINGVLTIGLVLTVDRCVLTSAISCVPLNILPSSRYSWATRKRRRRKFFFFFKLDRFAISTPDPSHHPPEKAWSVLLDCLKPLLSYLISLNLNFLTYELGIKIVPF